MVVNDHVSVSIKVRNKINVPLPLSRGTSYWNFQSTREKDTRGIRIKNERVRLSFCADLIRYLEHQKESTQELLQTIRPPSEGAGRERHRETFSNYSEGITEEKTLLGVTMITEYLGIYSPRNAQNPHTGHLKTR